MIRQPVVFDSLCFSEFFLFYCDRFNWICGKKERHKHPNICFCLLLFLKIDWLNLSQQNTSYTNKQTSYSVDFYSQNMTDAAQNYLCLDESP